MKSSASRLNEIEIWCSLIRNLAISTCIETVLTSAKTLTFDRFLPKSSSMQRLKHRQLRTRRALRLFKNVPLKTRRVLSPLTLYSNSTLMVLNRALLNSDNAFLALNLGYVFLNLSFSQVLSQEYYGLQASSDRRATELDAQVVDLRTRLETYERLEQELDQVVMQAAECESK